MKKLLLIFMVLSTTKLYTQQFVQVIQDSASTIAFQIQSVMDAVQLIDNSVKTVNFQIKAIEKLGEGSWEGVLSALRYQAAALGRVGNAMDNFSMIKLNKDIYNNRVKNSNEGLFLDTNGNTLTADEALAQGKVNIKNMDEWVAARGKFSQSELSKATESLRKSTLNVADVLQDTKYYTDNMKARAENIELLFEEMGQSDGSNKKIDYLAQITGVIVQQNEDALNLAKTYNYAASEELRLQAERDKNLEQHEQILQEKAEMQFNAPSDFEYKERPTDNFFTGHKTIGENK